jgi:hypothetical protein
MRISSLDQRQKILLYSLYDIPEYRENIPMKVGEIVFLKQDNKFIQ